MNLEDFLFDKSADNDIAPPEADALREDQVLAESYMLDIRLDTIRSRLWILLQYDGALVHSPGNIAVLEVTGLSEFKWLCRTKVSPYHAGYIMKSTAFFDGAYFTIEIGYLDEYSLLAVGAGGRFIVGDADGASEAPPNFITDDDRTIRRGLTTWTTPFRALGVSKIGEPAVLN